MKLRIFCCYLCGEACTYKQDLCESCEKDFVSQLRPRYLGAEKLGPITILSAGTYKGALARLIKVCKSQPFGLQESLLIRRLKALLLHWSSEMELYKAEAIVTVPGQALRVFFQTDLARHLGLEAARTLKIPVLNVLKKSLLRGSQKHKSKLDRFAETHSKAFQVTEEPRDRKRILLIDDVCTTGATLMACERVLYEAGFDVVGAFVLARVPLKSAGACLERQNYAGGVR